MAALNCTEDPRWGAVYQSSVQELESRNYKTDQPSIWDIIITPQKELLATAEVNHDCFINLPQTGE